MDRAEIFRIFLAIIPFSDHHSANILHVFRPSAHTLKASCFKFVVCGYGSILTGKEVLNLCFESVPTHHREKLFCYSFLAEVPVQKANNCQETCWSHAIPKILVVWMIVQLFLRRSEASIKSISPGLIVLAQKNNNKGEHTIHFMSLNFKLINCCYLSITYNQCWLTATDLLILWRKGVVRCFWYFKLEFG